MRCATSDGWRSAAASAPRWLRGWLFERGSMSARLRAHGVRAGHGGRLSVHRVAQRVQRTQCAAAQPAELRAQAATWQREVLLLLDHRAVLWATSTASRHALRGAWRNLHRLGERPLGDGLFGRPDLRRGPIQVRHLAPAHPLLRRARRALAKAAGAAGPNASHGAAGAQTAHGPKTAERGAGAPQGCWARRSALLLRGRALWVTELFLPGDLAPPRA